MTSKIVVVDEPKRRANDLKLLHGDKNHKAKVKVSSNGLMTFSAFRLSLLFISHFHSHGLLKVSSVSSLKSQNYNSTIMRELVNHNGELVKAAPCLARK